MKKLFLYGTVALLTLATTTTVEAKDKKKKSKGRHGVSHVKDHYDRDYDHGRTRNIYVIERDRPVQRVVYIGDDGRYYRLIDSRRVYVRERYFDSYPSRYYTPDGRRRVNISIPF